MPRRAAIAILATSAGVAGGASASPGASANQAEAADTAASGRIPDPVTVNQFGIWTRPRTSLRR